MAAASAENLLTRNALTQHGVRVCVWGIESIGEKRVLSLAAILTESRVG